MFSSTCVLITVRIESVTGEMLNDFDDFVAVCAVYMTYPLCESVCISREKIIVVFSVRFEVILLVLYLSWSLWLCAYASLFVLVFTHFPLCAQLYFFTPPSVQTTRKPMVLASTITLPRNITVHAAGTTTKLHQKPSAKRKTDSPPLKKATPTKKAPAVRQQLPARMSDTQQRPPVTWSRHCRNENVYL